MILLKGESNTTGGGRFATDHGTGTVRLPEHWGLRPRWGGGHATPVAPQPRGKGQTPVNPSASIAASLPHAAGATGATTRCTGHIVVYR